MNPSYFLRPSGNDWDGLGRLPPHSGKIPTPLGKTWCLPPLFMSLYHCLTGTREDPNLPSEILGCLVGVILAIPSHLLNFVHLLGGNERVKFHFPPVEGGGELPLGHYPLGHYPVGHPKGLPITLGKHKASQGLAMWAGWTEAWKINIVWKKSQIAPK